MTNLDDAISAYENARDELLDAETREGLRIEQERLIAAYSTAIEHRNNEMSQTRAKIRALEEELAEHDAEIVRMTGRYHETLFGVL